MPRGFGRLSFRRRRHDPSPDPQPALARPPIDPELAPLGPPVLLPRAIFRQVLFDATELVPAWARPRSDGSPTPTREARPKPKRARRTTSEAAPDPKAAATTRRRPRSSGGSTKPRS